MDSALICKTCSQDAVMVCLCDTAKSRFCKTCLPDHLISATQKAHTLLPLQAIPFIQTKKDQQKFFSKMNMLDQLVRRVTSRLQRLQDTKRSLVLNIQLAAQQLKRLVDKQLEAKVQEIERISTKMQFELKALKNSFQQMRYSDQYDKQSLAGRIVDTQQLAEQLLLQPMDYQLFTEAFLELLPNMVTYHFREIQPVNYKIVYPDPFKQVYKVYLPTSENFQEFSDKSDFKIKRAMACCCLPDGTVFVAGGRLQGCSSKQTGLSDSGLTRISSLVDMQAARDSMALVYFQNTIFAFGGWDEEIKSGLKTNQKFNFIAHQWVSIKSFQTELHNLTGVCSSQQIYLAGQGSKKIYKYDPADDEFSIININLSYFSSVRLLMPADQSLIALQHDKIHIIKKQNEVIVREVPIQVRNWWGVCAPVIHNKKIFFLEHSNKWAYDLSTNKLLLQQMLLQVKTNTEQSNHSLFTKTPLCCRIEGENTVVYTGKNNNPSHIAVVFSPKPVRPMTDTLFYFQIQVQSVVSQAEISVGFLKEPCNTTKHLGRLSDSYGLSCQGKFFYNSNIGEVLTRKIGKDSKVGVGLDFESRDLFFTVDGQFVGVAMRDLPPDEVFPAVSMKGCQDSVRFFFGEPFAFDIEGYARELSFRRFQKIMDEPLEVSDLNEMIYYYLLMNGYEETLQKFKRASGVQTDCVQPPTIQFYKAEKEKFLPIYNNYLQALEPDLPVEEDESFYQANINLQKRAKVRQMIMEGRIDQVLEFIKANFSSAFQINFDIESTLKVQKFFQMVKNCSLESVLQYAQESLVPLKNFSVKISQNRQMPLKEALGLICYENPLQSPLGFLLQNGQKQLTAEKINEDLLRSEGLSTYSQLQICLHHLFELQKLYYEQQLLTPILGISLQVNSV